MPKPNKNEEKGTESEKLEESCRSDMPLNFLRRQAFGISKLETRDTIDLQLQQSKSEYEQNNSSVKDNIEKYVVES